MYNKTALHYSLVATNPNKILFRRELSDKFLFSHSIYCIFKAHNSNVYVYCIPFLQSIFLIAGMNLNVGIYLNSKV